jgi:hypothetical protein
VCVGLLKESMEYYVPYSAGVDPDEVGSVTFGPGRIRIQESVFRIRTRLNNFIPKSSVPDADPGTGAFLPGSPTRISESLVKIFLGKK